MFDEHTRQALHAEWDHCMNSPESEEEPEPFHKFTPPDDCAMMVANLMAGGKGAWEQNIGGPVRTAQKVDGWSCTSVSRHGISMYPFHLNRIHMM